MSVSTPLLPHPTHAVADLPDSRLTLAASCIRHLGDGLQLCYTLRGNLARLRLPAPQPPGFTEHLWQHTCFEAFIRPVGGTVYREFNFSPSGQWAIYDFSAYRERLAQPLPAAAPLIGLEMPDAETLHLGVTLPAALLPMPADDHPACQLSLAAVLEDTEGTCSYWAIHHAGERPDFHHPETFILCLA